MILFPGHPKPSSALSHGHKRTPLPLASLFAQALDALNKVCKQLSTEQLLDSFIPLVRRLAGGDWFTSRISACGLFAVAYGRVPPSTQEDLRNLFAQLCRDDTPMVRRGPRPPPSPRLRMASRPQQHSA